MPEDNLTPENLDSAAQDAANAAANAADAAANAADAAANAADAAQDAAQVAAEGAVEGQPATDVFGQLANALADDNASVPEATTPVQTQPFSDPNKPAEFAQPVQYDPAAQQVSYDAATAQQAQYTQPTQAYDPAQQAQYTQPTQAYDPAQEAQYTQPAQPYDPNQQPYDQQPYGAAPGASQYANGSNPGTTPMVLGILSIVFAGIVGLVLSIIGLKKSGPVLAADPNNGRAKAGKITSIIGLILSILAIVFAIALFAITMMGLSAAAENPEAFIDTMEQLSSYDETGELQQGLDELKQELGMTEDSTEGSNTDADASGQGSELTELDYGLTSVIPAEAFALKATGDNEADVRALAEQVMNAVKEPSAEQQKALDAYFDDSFKLSYGGTFEQFGVSKEDYTKWASGDFQYAVQEVTATDKYGWADVSIECRDWNHFIDAYYDTLIASDAEDMPDMSDQDKYYAWMGEAMKKAMDETDKVEYVASINVTKDGDTWKVDQYSLDSLYYNLYGLY